MRRRLTVILMLTVLLWLPAVSTAPVASAASQCTIWSSSRIPPSTIRVYRTRGPHAGTVQTVDFRTYVGVVLAAEWSASWPAATQETGAVAVKEYAWYFIMNPRGYSAGGSCYDVIDNTNDQIYYPEGRTPSAGQLAAIDATYYESITRAGKLVLTGYRTGSSGSCGFDADGYHLFQRSSYSCASAGMTADQILKIYYGPGLTIWKPPARPSVVFESPGAGNGTGIVTSTGSATAAWTEEVADGTTITSRRISLQMALPINASCSVDRWLPASPAWISTGPSPQTVSGLKTGYCYRFVVGLTDSTAKTTYSPSSLVRVDPLAPVAIFSNPSAAGTVAPWTDPTATILWTETSAPGTSIATRTATMEYASHTLPGSCAGGNWVSGSSNHNVSGFVATGLIHYYCYRWRVTLLDSAGHTGTWLSGILVEPAS